ncbi:MAG: endonuclease domain-containing protein [Chloroflexia bacterium]|nr:endonuclease domain-containing protein [Chloroflexia bacterium]
MMGSQHRNLNNIPGARELRTSETHAEAVLWEALRGRKLNGLKFRRQHPIGPFVADFCCAKRRLIVELDGDIHATQQERDAEREALLHQAGYSVIRFANEQVLHDLAAVLEAIDVASRQLPPRREGFVSRREGW